jgi:hypothetical protein
MFLPPGTDSQYVPLACVTWSWALSLTQSYNKFNNNDGWAQVSASPAVPTTPKSLAATAEPQWTMVIGPSNTWV